MTMRSSSTMRRAASLELAPMRSVTCLMLLVASAAAFAPSHAPLVMRTAHVTPVPVAMRIAQPTQLVAAAAASTATALTAPRVILIGAAGAAGTVWYRKREVRKAEEARKAEFNTVFGELPDNEVVDFGLSAAKAVWGITSWAATSVADVVSEDFTRAKEVYELSKEEVATEMTGVVTPTQVEEKPAMKKTPTTIKGKASKAKAAESSTASRLAMWKNK